MKLKSLMPILAVSLLLAGCGDNQGGSVTPPSGYDYIVGTDYSDLVKITFKYGNIEGKVGQTYKVWGISRGGTLGTQLKPAYPSSSYNCGYYGLSADSCWADGTCMDLGVYKSNSDTTVYCRYYGSGYTSMPTWRIHFGLSKNDYGWSASVQNTSYYNAEIRQMPNVANNFTIKTDIGSSQVNDSVMIYLKDMGYKTFNYYFDQNATRPVNGPFQNTINELWCLISK